MGHDAHMAEEKKTPSGTLHVRRLQQAYAMEGNRLVHHERRISALLFVHAHVGSGKPISQEVKRGFDVTPDVGRSGIRAAASHSKNFIKMGANAKDG